MSTATPRLGLWLAIAAGVFGSAFSVVALVSMFTPLIPDFWKNPAGFAPSLPLAWCYLGLMVCITEIAPPSRRIWANLGLSFATIYATINSIVYFTQLFVVTPALLAKQGDSVATLLFAPNSFMQSINGLAYGLMSLSALLTSQSFANQAAQAPVRWTMVAHGVLAPFIVGALFWPWMTAIGALWIVTFPAMAIALALHFQSERGSGVTASASGPGFSATFDFRPR